TSLRSLLYSDFCQLYNPFEHYFESLPEYDLKTDYITQLANTITTTKQELWQHCFKKWLVAMVGCVLNDKVINHTVIVFSGKQGLGKTTWVERLVPKELKEYLFSGTINPNNKDTLVQLAECMLINLDELENLNRSEIGSLKEIITKTHIRMRKAYGHNNETMPRRASFAGSVNTAQFLNDSTGSRRFLCFEVEAIQYQHDIDTNLVYAQALHLFNEGFRYWFNQEEIKYITDNNEQYQLRSPEEEFLHTLFEPCTKETSTTFLN
ncbi:MAG TPA: virulence-associated E family protein, partial [Chitinophagaceae bacterium]|nr:virulence-associated E family protein [Chitinophagaceae bacterium]